MPGLGSYYSEDRFRRSQFYLQGLLKYSPPATLPYLWLAPPHKVVPSSSTSRLASEPARLSKEPAWKHKLWSMLWRRTVEEGAGGTEKDKRQKSLQVLFALDHALESVGHGLLTFQVGADLLPRPLSSSEVRYKVPVAGCESGQGINSGAACQGRFRLAVRDRVSGRKRWEAPREFGQGGRPHLSVFSDHGSDITAAMSFAAFSLKLRIHTYSDVFHDTNNDVLNAISDTGLSGILHECTFLLNSEHGPWQSCSFYTKLKEGWLEFLASACPEDDLFAEVYERIAFDLGEEGQTDSYGHFQSIFDSLQRGGGATKLDERVCLSRWPLF